MSSLISLEITSDIDDLVAAVARLQFNLEEVLKFSGKQIEHYIREQVFTVLVANIANVSGNFPAVYRDHLIAFLRRLPISITGSTTLEIRINLSSLGDKEQLALAYHDHAILGEAYPPWTSIHLPKVELPWGGKEGDLMSSKKRRQEFWETVIINRNLEGFIETLGNPGIQAAVRNEIGDPPTYGQVALRRVGVWAKAGVAPQWLLLQYGTPKGSLPAIRPTNFLGKLEEGCQCVADQVISSAVTTLMRVFDRELSGGRVIRVNSAGRPIAASSGQFVKYADIRNESPVNVHACIEV